MKCEVQQSGLETVESTVGSSRMAKLARVGVAVLGVFAALQLAPVAAEAGTRGNGSNRSATGAARMGNVLRRGTTGARTPAQRGTRTTTARTTRRAARTTQQAEHAEQADAFPTLPEGSLYNDEGHPVAIRPIFSKYTYAPATGMAGIEMRLHEGQPDYVPEPSGNFHYDFMARRFSARPRGKDISWSTSTAHWDDNSNYGRGPEETLKAISNELTAQGPLSRGYVFVRAPSIESDGYRNTERVFMMTHQPGSRGAAGKVRLFDTSNGNELTHDEALGQFWRKGGMQIVWTRAN